jgi:hypothetical protein
LPFALGPAPMFITTGIAFRGTTGEATYSGTADVVIGDQAIPRKILFKSGGDPQPWLTMGIEVLNGIPECVYLELDAEDAGVVRGKHLTLIRLEEWITHIVAGCARKVERTPTGSALTVAPVTQEQVKVVARMQHRRRDPNDRELLEQVAAIYKDNPSAPVAAVMRAMGMSRRTAARWAGRCSDIGLLPKVQRKGQKRL